MKEKTIIQISKMKKQTIGIEIEMNRISRERAANIAAEFFGTNRSEFTDSTNSYMTWSAWENNNREWKFQRDTSIQGRDEEKCELVTPLRKAGARSSPSRGQIIAGQLTLNF